MGPEREIWMDSQTEFRMGFQLGFRMEQLKKVVEKF